MQFHPELSTNKALYDLLGKAFKQTERIVELVNDLLDVNRIQSGQLKLTKTNFNINDLISDCIDQEVIQKHTHEVVTTGEQNISIYADKARIEQVISNLISNAVKYSPEADKVVVHTSLTNNNAFYLSVTDYGIGIPETAFSHVFDRFFRVDATAHQFSGLGLGLYITSQIIQRHGGTIGLNSKEGEGSTFWFTLPVSVEVNE